MHCLPAFLGGVGSDHHNRRRIVHGTAVCTDGVSNTKRVLLWHSVTGQSKRRKTYSLFVGPLSDLTASGEDGVEFAKWMASRTLTDQSNRSNLLGFAM